MQQNGQEQQEGKHQQQTAEQPEREGEPDSTTVSAQEEQRLTAEQQRAEECLDLLRRTQADFVNYRRRMSQEQAEGRIAAQSALLSRLLPVLDDFGRALEPYHQSWPRTHGCRACSWLREGSQRCLTSWACNRSAHPESPSIRAGTRPSRRRRERMCLKERSCRLPSQGIPWESVSFVLLRSVSPVPRLPGVMRLRSKKILNSDEIESLRGFSERK